MFSLHLQLIICENANHHHDHFRRYRIIQPQSFHRAGGYLEQHIAPFSTAAHYSLCPKELDQILGSKEYLADYLNMLVVAAKQLQYILYSKAREYYTEDIFCKGQPYPKVQGDHNNIHDDHVAVLIPVRLNLKQDKAIMICPAEKM